MLWSSGFLQHLIEFQKMTALGSFRFSEISPLIEALKDSALLSYILKDPKSASAISCLRNFVEKSPHLSNDFTSRFVALANLSVSLHASSMSIANQSFVAKVVTNAVSPKTKLTQQSYDEIRNRLIDSFATRKSVQSVAVPSVPTMVKLTLTENTMPIIINSMGHLHRTFVDGARSQNRVVDSYVRNALKEHVCP